MSQEHQAYVKDGMIVAPSSSGARGAAIADEMNAVHMPKMLNQMVGPAPGDVVDHVELKSLTKRYNQLAHVGASMNLAQRTEIIQVGTRIYNISPDAMKVLAMQHRVKMAVDRAKDAIASRKQ